MFRTEADKDDVEENLVINMTVVREEAIRTEDEPSKIVDVDDLDDMEFENYVPYTTFLNFSQG